MKRTARGKDNFVWAASAVIGAMAFAALLTMPLLLNPPIEDRARVLLKENQDAMFALTSYRAECWTTTFTENPHIGQLPTTEYTISSLIAVKPDLMRYDYWMAAPDATGAFQRKTSAPLFGIACDGKTKIRRDGDRFTVASHPGPQYMINTAEPWKGFYYSDDSQYFRLGFPTPLLSNPLDWLRELLEQDKNHSLISLHLRARASVDGTFCDVVTYDYRNFNGREWSETTGTLYIGPDKLVRRRMETKVYERKPVVRETHDAVIKNIQTNFPAPPPQTFAYTPPQGTTPKIP